METAQAGHALESANKSGLIQLCYICHFCEEEMNIENFRKGLPWRSSG